MSDIHASDLESGQLRMRDLPRHRAEGLVRLQEFQGGAMASAMSKAFALKTRVSEVMTALGLTIDPKTWGNLITQPN